MDMHQISVTFEASEDRILLRMNTRQGQLFQLWLTRRLCWNLWPVLNDMVAHASAGSTAAGRNVMPQARDMLVESARSQALSQSDFQQPFQAEQAEQPWGEAPALVTQVELTAASQTLQLKIHDRHKRTLDLSLPLQTTMAIRELLAKALTKSQWGIALEPTQAPAAAASTPAWLN